MTPEVALDLFREALWLTAMIVGVLVVPSLLVRSRGGDVPGRHPDQRTDPELPAAPGW